MCPLSIRRIFIIPLILSPGLILNSSSALAQDSMELIATIVLERDSTYIPTLMPIGDFNADGHPDLALGVRQDFFNLYEAVYLYFGGPDFDNSPDLVIPGEPQNTDSYCIDEADLITFFGMELTGLGDFNGDGYDDIAISAPGFCPYVYREGRIYIFFGSPEPDSIADVVIDGHEYYEYLGDYIGAGDFNGDGFHDLIATAPRIVYPDDRLYIYQGSSSPDGTYDWMRDFIGQDIYTTWRLCGFDINDDGFDDFCIDSYADTGSFKGIYLGGDPLNQEPAFYFDHGLSFTEDISGDDIDDIMIRPEDMRWYLCLGGDSLDLDPDYYVGSVGGPSFTYSLIGEGTKLMMDDNLQRSFIMYNTGVPFDSIPRDVFGYSQESWNKHNIGDINGDGVEDIALKTGNDTLGSYVEIYSIFRTGVEEENGFELFPNDYAILSCYPNPFNSNVLLNIATYDEPDAEIRIYDIAGRLIRSVITIEGNATWDATDNAGRKVSSGVYFARAKTSRNFNTIKLLYLK